MSVAPKKPLRLDQNSESQTSSMQSQSLKSVQVCLKSVPRHVAIVMDGNRRWAKSKGLPSTAGHVAGVQTVEKITQAAIQAGIHVLTLYAFSTENWSRSEQEVGSLMKLMTEQLLEKTTKAVEEGIRIRVIGERESLPAELKNAIEHAEQQTVDGTRLNLCFAINYGARNEMMRAFQKLALRVKEQRLCPKDIREWHLSEALDTYGMGDPDLFIRTSGEHRLSNFLLWQMAYTELYFTQRSWPDFEPEYFFEALSVYESRMRRYGA